MSERYTLRIAKTTEKNLRDLQAKQFKQIVSKILSLQGTPRPQACKALKAYEGGYRVDFGEYRILYTIDDENQLVDVFRVGKRNDNEVYENL
ncbi:type II toxin-antitoxin system RelE/ParE family toxin [Desmonostoc muscorum CCALA 125]|nr:type II toxin-antitoxin system RelE/ParE family toxin [Desmonostoc muscorum CCALA 125]